jgi:hypothetical protein
VIARVPVRFLVALALAATALVVAAATPAVRVELRRSFTRMPAEYAELSFTGVPAIRPYGTRSAAVVAVTLLDHGAADRDFAVRFTLARPGGAVLRTATAAIRARPEEPAGVVRRLTVPGRSPTGPYLVAVALIGHPQTLHYRIENKETQP